MEIRLEALKNKNKNYQIHKTMMSVVLNTKPTLLEVETVSIFGE